MSTGSDPEALLALSLALARDGGRFVRDHRPDRFAALRSKASASDLVTEMDAACEERLRAAIRRERSDDAILGEEGDDEPGGSGLTWVLDPIDGTTNYVYDLPGYSVSVAVVTGDPHTPGAWQPIAGAVADPTHGRVFAASRGGGAFVAPLSDVGQPSVALMCSEVTELTRALVTTGFGYDARLRADQFDAVGALMPYVVDVRRLGSAALDLCYVASGRVDAYLESGLHHWDIAAGVVIAREAGATVTGWQPEEPAEWSVLAAPPTLHTAIAQVLKERRDARLSAGSIST